MVLSSIPAAAIGSIAASAIAAGIGFVSLVISKENKTSEFRQAWIDALRSEICEVIANANLIRGGAVAGHRTKADLFAATQENFLAINKATTAIRLRLNPSEKDSKSVLSKLHELEVLMETHPIAIPACRKCEAELIAVAQVVLKSEWRRVSRGEPTFVGAKWFGLLVIGLTLWYLVWA